MKNLRRVKRDPALAQNHEKTPEKPKIERATPKSAPRDGKTVRSLLRTSPTTQITAGPRLHEISGLVVDGEMPAAELRECLGALLPDDPVAPLDILSHEIVFDRLERDLNLGRKEWQEAILALREKRPDIRVVLFDNLSCLLPSVQEDKRDDWVQRVLPFIITLRRRCIATVLLHHAGKGGDQRGTSAREDAPDTIIRLDELPDHDATEGTAFRVTFTKARGCYGDHLAEIEARLADDTDGPLVWSWKPVEGSNKQRLIALVRAGIASGRDAAEELELTPGAVSKLKRKLQNEGKLKPGRKLALAL